MSNARRQEAGQFTVATLVRTIPVRLLDVSRGGCRLEVGRAVAPGVSGRLSVELNGRLRVDDVRVARCQARVGAGAVFQVGAELLRTRRLHRRSMRLAIGRIIGEHALGAGHPEGNHQEPVAPEPVNRREQREKSASRAPPMPVPVPVVVGGK